MRGRDTRRTLFCVLVLSLSSRVADAYECKTVDDRPFRSLFWLDRSIPYVVRAGSEDMLPLGEVVEAAAAWSQPDCTDVFLDYEGIASSESNLNQVALVPSSWSATGRPVRAVGLTTTEFVSQTGRIVKADVELNGDNFTFTDTTRGCPLTIEYDMRAVLTHEFGHLLGLDHTREFVGNETDPTMAPEVAACESAKRTLEPDDRAGVCALYPSFKPAQPCSPLPDSDESLINNQAFGCRAQGQSAPVLWLLLAVCIHRRRKGCPQARSGR